MQSFLRLLAPLLVLLAEGGDLLAQAAGPDCEYAACALRVKGGSLVKGTDEEKVVGLGFWVGDLDEAFDGSPLSQELAASYRQRHNVGQLVWLAGSIALFLGLIDSYADENRGTVVTVSGLVVLFTGVFISRSGRDRLNRAIWEYNRLVN